MTTPIANDSINKDQFLQLFVTQVRNQNPVEPMNNTEFMEQVSMFTMVEQTTNMAQNFEAMLDNSTRSLAMAKFNQATALIGRSVTFTDAATGSSAQGVVDGVTQRDGEVYLEIGDQLVLPSAVTAVRAG